jgi:hypothetical protein
MLLRQLSSHHSPTQVLPFQPKRVPVLKTHSTKGMNEKDI